MFDKAELSDLAEFKFGHSQDREKATGCTVVIAPEGARCGVSIVGGGPATRETDLLRPENMVQDIHAVVLAGGSAFGLEASSGVMDALAKRSIGFSLMGIQIPIVTGACLFDLTVGEFSYPDKSMGAKAVEHAFSNEKFEQGNVGAGIGASVGKILGPQHSMKSGFGYQVLRFDDLVVGALVATNALGNVIDSYGQSIAGCINEKGELIESLEAFSSYVKDASSHGTSSTVQAPTNTTLGIVVCNAKLDKGQATKVAAISNDAYARAIKPVHTSNDGDAIFTFASGKVDTLPDLVAIMATEAMEQAILNSVLYAESAYGLTAAPDLRIPK